MFKKTKKKQKKTKKKQISCIYLPNLKINFKVE